MALPIHRLRRLLARLFVAAAALTALAWPVKGRLSGPESIDPALLAPPAQGATARGEFSFDYKGKSCRVRPVAAYELHGLVVSHNDIESVADIYHDSTSVDTKDLCVIWGGNLERDDYLGVRFRSGPWTCYFSYPRDVRFAHDELGNNHLITDDPAIRRRIAGVRVGDQVRLRGLLVDYQMSDWGGFWRETSTRREDGDCEVVFVEELEVLHRGTPLWYAIDRAGWILLVLIPPLYLAAAWWEAGRPGSQLGRL